jgi:ubiquinone/menaquinone biosynthesis C-methylase UbiE
MVKNARLTEAEREFTPLLGRSWLTPFYDRAIGIFTREAKWRRETVRQARLEPGDRVIDVGCGTGTLLRALMADCPEAGLVGVEPDPAALAIARKKFGQGADLVRWHNGFLDSLVLADDWRPNIIVSSLVLHQVPLPEKRAILDEIERLLSADGVALIADYMRQDRPLMRALFRTTVQFLDGVEDTQPSADGAVEKLLDEIFANAELLAQIHTATGTISLWRGTKKGNVR